MPIQPVILTAAAKQLSALGAQKRSLVACANILRSIANGNVLIDSQAADRYKAAIEAGKGDFAALSAVPLGLSNIALADLQALPDQALAAIERSLQQTTTPPPPPPPPLPPMGHKIISGGATGETSLEVSHLYAFTHVGGRKSNEDGVALFANGKRYLFVCDGMGGQGNGEVASAMALETVKESLAADQTIEEAIKAAHAKIAADPRGAAEHGMRTTLSAFEIEGDQAKVYRAGDSPVYLVDDQNRVFLLALPQVQYVLLLKDWMKSASGQLKTRMEQLEALLSANPNPPFAEDIIASLADIERDIQQLPSSPIKSAMLAVTKNLGHTLPDQLLAATVTLQPGYRLLACSDGFDLSPDEIRAILAKKLPFGETVKALVDEAVYLERKKDNVSLAGYEHEPATPKPVDVDAELARLRDQYQPLLAKQAELEARLQRLQAARPEGQLAVLAAKVREKLDPAQAEKTRLTEPADIRDRDLGRERAILSALEAEASQAGADLSYNFADFKQQYATALTTGQARIDLAIANFLNAITDADAAGLAKERIADGSLKPQRVIEARAALAKSISSLLITFAAAHDINLSTFITADGKINNPGAAMDCIKNAIEWQVKDLTEKAKTNAAYRDQAATVVKIEREVGVLRQAASSAEEAVLALSKHLVSIGEMSGQLATASQAIAEMAKQVGKWEEELTQSDAGKMVEEEITGETVPLPSASDANPIRELKIEMNRTKEAIAIALAGLNMLEESDLAKLEQSFASVKTATQEKAAELSREKEVLSRNYTERSEALRKALLNIVEAEAAMAVATGQTVTLDRPTILSITEFELATMNNRVEELGRQIGELNANIEKAAGVIESAGSAIAEIAARIDLIKTSLSA